MKTCGVVLIVASALCCRNQAAIAAPPADSSPAAGIDPAQLAPIDDAVKTALDEKKLPGCVVIVGRPEGVVLRKAYGNRQTLPEPAPMTVDTLFDLASLTKPLATATAVMQLVERERLDLDDPVARHLPEFAAAGKESITVRDLLVHRSGLIADNAMSDYADGPIRARERLLALKPTSAPRSRFVYSDVNFMILGLLVERVSKRPLDEYVRDEICRPLGMTETGYRPAEALRARTAPTERRDGRWMRGEVHDPRAWKLEGVAGHAGLFGTADDLARYAADALAGLDHDGSKLLKRETWRAMTTAHVVRGKNAKGEPTEDVRGLGWDMRSRYSTNRGAEFSSAAFGHGGFTGTSLWIDPEKRIYVVFLSNRVHPDGKGSVNRLAGTIGEIAARAATK